MKNKIDTNVRAFGASILLKHISTLMNELDGVRNADDIENIHRMRVASRRLRNALPIFQDCFPPKKVIFWNKEIRLITKSLGAARDLDVQIIFVNKALDEIQDPKLRRGINRLILRLKQRRENIQKDVVSSVEEIETNGVLNSLNDVITPYAQEFEEGSAISRSLFKRAQETISERLQDLMAHEVYIYDPQQIEQLHAMRISAKYLRYTLETFSSIYPGNLERFIQSARQIQDMLGGLHDCDVWLDFLPGFLENERQKTSRYFGNERPIRRIIPGVEHFHALCSIKRQNFYEQFLKDWNKIKQEQIWEQLKERIDISGLYQGSPFPPLETHPPELHSTEIQES